jgi:hypothetical protein
MSPRRGRGDEGRCARSLPAAGAKTDSADGTANWEKGVERSADQNDLRVADLIRDPATFELRFDLGAGARECFSGAQRASMEARQVLP